MISEDNRPEIVQCSLSTISSLTVGKLDKKDGKVIGWIKDDMDLVVELY